MAICVRNHLVAFTSSIIQMSINKKFIDYKRTSNFIDPLSVYIAVSRNQLILTVRDSLGGFCSVKITNWKFQKYNLKLLIKMRKKYGQT